MGAYKYLHTVMNRLHNMVYNGSQEGTNKDQILDSLISIMKEYNESVEKEDRVRIEDFRKEARAWQ